MDTMQVEDERIIKKDNRIIYNKKKKIIDFSLSAVALVILSPLLLIVAILIKLESKGPVIFSQKRVGLMEKSLKCINLDLWLLMLKS